MPDMNQLKHSRSLVLKKKLKNTPANTIPLCSALAQTWHICEEGFVSLNTPNAKMIEVPL